MTEGRRSKRFGGTQETADPPGSAGYAISVGTPERSSHEGHRYERHRPEETVLDRVVAEHWPSFRQRVEAIGPLPRFVVREVEEYLRCGLLEYGFIRVACEGCGLQRLMSAGRLGARIKRV